MNKPIQIATIAAAWTVLMIEPISAQEIAQASDSVEKAKAQYAQTYERLVQLQKNAPVWKTLPGGAGQGDVLSVRSSNATPETEANLREDLSVMERILTKAIGEKSEPTAMGVKVAFSPGRDVTSALYLEGFGALFLLSIDFPLLPPPSQPEAKTESSPQTGTAWEQAKKELYGEADEAKALRGARSGALDAEFGVKQRIDLRYSAADASPKKLEVMAAPKYDADQVARLKDTLAASLRNAANIRDLKADESVTVCVSSSSVSPTITTAPLVLQRLGGSGTQVSKWQVAGAASGVTPSNPGTLTLRVKKSDAAALANGTMTQEEFRKRVTALIY